MLLLFLHWLFACPAVTIVATAAGGAAAAAEGGRAGDGGAAAHSVVRQQSSMSFRRSGSLMNLSGKWLCFLLGSPAPGFFCVASALKGDAWDAWDAWDARN